MISSTTPPATRKAARLTPITLKRKVPKRAKKTRRPKATSEARAAVSRISSRESPWVMAMKIGTTPMGSTTKKTAERATSPEETHSLT